MDRNMTNESGADLQQIRGIGPGVARRLNEAGIADAAALASAAPETVAAALQGMPIVSSERIHEWIEAARLIAPPQTSVAEENGQHYATFRLELLLDLRNEVRRTRVKHVQSGNEESWAGWAAERLLRFVGENAGLQPSPTADEVASKGQEVAEARPFEPYLHDLTVVDTQSREPRHIVRRGQPYDVRFGLALTGEGDTPAEPARMRAALYARSIGGKQRVTLGQGTAMRPMTPDLDVAFGITPAAELSPGPYRLELELDVETEDARRWPTASLHEGLLYII